MHATLFTRPSLPSLESIDFQGYDPVCKTLSIIIDEFRSAHVGTKNKIDAAAMKAFSDLVQKTLRQRFKLKALEFEVDDVPHINAYAIPPDVVKNNVLTKTYGAWWTTAADGQKALEKGLNKNLGWVDLAKVEVGGFYQDLKCTVSVTYGMLTASDFSADEIVAALLHEVGHIFSYLELLGYTFSTCFTLIDTVSRLDKAKSDVEKVKIFKNAEDVTGIEISNKELLGTELDNNAIAVSIFSDIFEQSKSEFGATMYDVRSWESLSDQFSARMGMTVHLATSLDKIMRHGGDISYQSSFSYWTMNIVRWLLLTASSVLVPAMSIFLILELIVLMFNPFRNVYDNAGERLTRLRLELVNQMKRRDIAPAQRVELNKDLGVIDALIKKTNDKESYHQKLWLFLSSDARDQKRRRILLQDIQALASNDLFAVANLLKTLK